MEGSVHLVGMKDKILLSIGQRRKVTSKDIYLVAKLKKRYLGHLLSMNNIVLSRRQRSSDACKAQEDGTQRRSGAEDSWPEEREK